MLRLVRKLTPTPLRNLYHAALSLLGALTFRFPSRELIVIGVTGTKGKSTVANLIEYLLTSQGYQVGLASTPIVAIAGTRRTNEAKMTMVGRLALHRLLRRMVRAGCEYAVIEMTSEGLAQHRALGVDVDVAVFTNLTPEHLDAHGSFRAYRAAKGRLFRKLAGRRKQLGGRRVEKIAVVNADDPHANYFAAFRADRLIFFRTGERATVDLPPSASVLTADHVRADRHGVRFRVGRLAFTLPHLGTFSAENALAALAVGQTQGITLEAMRTLLAAAPPVPGRMEFIERGQPFRVIVDYAHEPVSLASFYGAVRTMKPKRLLCVLGATGGGRDVGKRPVLGGIAAEQCDVIFVTDEDPYDDDPRQIMDAVAAGAIRAGFTPGQNLHVVPDRAVAIHRAVAEARPGDAVVITGKGNEPWMVVRGKKIPWNDRQIARDAIRAAGAVDNSLKTKKTRHPPHSRR